MSLVTPSPGTPRVPFSFELYPPRSASSEEALHETVRHLAAAGPDFLSVTYGAGGSSGGRSLEVLRRVRAAVPSDFCVIAVGGVTSEQDVQDRIDAGATLVQGYTAFLYEGPTWAARINRLRRRRLRRAAR